MNAYICDNKPCRKQEQPDRGMAGPPRGWYSVTVWPTKGDYRTLHLCSPACLQAFSETEIPIAEPAPPPIDEPLGEPPVPLEALDVI